MSNTESEPIKDHEATILPFPAPKSDINSGITKELQTEPPESEGGVAAASGVDSHAVETTERRGKLQSVTEWVRQRKLAVSAGALALASTGYTVGNGELDEITDNLVDSAPWIGTGLIASEVAWTGGGAVMLAAAGVQTSQQIRSSSGFATFKNLLSVRKRVTSFNEDVQKDTNLAPTKHLTENKAFRAGFGLNALGAVGTMGTFTAGVMETMPPTSWGILSFGAMDLAQTVATRVAVWGALMPNKNEANTGTNNDGSVDTAVKSKERSKESVNVRLATEQDIDRLVDLDLKMFRKAYGEEMPTRAQVTDMLTRRFNNLQNGGGWMHVCEVNGQVEAFMTIFLTNKPENEFVSWEDSTNKGTLDGVVEPDGRYAYVANLTVGAKASKHNGRERLTANAFASAIRSSNVESAYFESRIPQFRSWLKREDIDFEKLSKPELDHLAERYVNLTEMQDGKEAAVDFQIRMYESSGMKRGTLVSDAFNDPESLGYGVVFTTPVPRVPKVLKGATANTLAFAARSSKVAGKMF